MSSRIMVDAGGPGDQPPPVAEPEPQRSPVEAPERGEPEPAPTTPPTETAPPEPPEADGEPPKEDANAIQKRMDRLNWEKHEAIRQRNEAIAEHQRWLEQMQRQNQPPPSSDYERGRREAEEARIAGEFNRACDNLFNRGVEEFGAEMGEARDRLLSVGYGPGRPDALAAITQLPDGHRVYRELARDLDRAARILTLPPIPMAVELARLSSVPGGDVSRETPDRNAAPVTRAPPPVSRIGGNSRAAEIPLDHPNMTVAEHIRRRDKDERRSRIMR